MHICRLTYERSYIVFGLLLFQCSINVIWYFPMMGVKRGGGGGGVHVFEERGDEKKKGGADTPFLWKL